MTIFLGFVLLCIVYDVISDARAWRRVTFGVILALAIAGLMMLSYWDWKPTL